MGDSLKFDTIFDVFSSPEFESIAPKNIEGMKKLAYSCHVTPGFERLATWIDDWITHMEYYKKREWEEDEADPDIARAD